MCALWRQMFDLKEDGTADIEPDDIAQGELGDCYLLSSLSVLAGTLPLQILSRPSPDPLQTLSRSPPVPRPSAEVPRSRHALIWFNPALYLEFWALVDKPRQFLSSRRSSHSRNMKRQPEYEAVSNGMVEAMHAPGR